ncbi:hypothetical protein Pmani_034903 [Petrolisthes manimaculis]|uniref:SAMD1-like winged helix (WH) domain-containing protein n=1 Tax=Petrolisthes manimaculis TaxID=1843537 RepID=A0AAE1TNX2_9EUCA|nr:hypothetical protein Pmani_034903 [Petrolisthes manimaculis]
MKSSIRRCSDPLHCQHLWDAITTIRNHKQLPSFDRIRRYMSRMHTMESDEVEKHLEECASDNLIAVTRKVGQKGSKVGIEQEGFRLPTPPDTSGYPTDYRDLTDADYWDLTGADYPEIPLVSFTWQCREEGEELPSEGEKVTSDPPTSREEYGTGQGHEGGGCWGQGPGMMSNASPNFSISVNLFRTPYITYKIEVATRSKDGRTSGTGVEVEVVEGDPPTLTSACSPPWICRQVEGAQLVNPQKLILESGCVVEAGEEPVGEDGCGKVPLNVAGVAGSLIQPLDVMDVAIGLNQRKLALLDDFWVKFGSQFRTFDVQVTATRPGETSEGLALQRIRINEAPVGGTCTAEVMQDIHKDEEEEEEEEGSFEVEVRVGREEPPTLIVTALTEGFEIPKYSFFATTERGEKVTLTFSSKVILPYANLTLWAGVSDQLGAETLYMTAVVIPLLPSQELFKEYQTRKTLLKAVSARDQTRVDMLLRNNKANDEEEEDESSATQEKNKDMLSSVDKFSITSMDEVLQVNNILGSIADPLPKESQEGAVAALKTALPLWLNRRTLLLGLWLPLLVSLRV